MINKDKKNFVIDVLSFEVCFDTKSIPIVISLREKCLMIDSIEKY